MIAVRNARWPWAGTRENRCLDLVEMAISKDSNISRNRTVSPQDSCDGIPLPRGKAESLLSEKRAQGKSWPPLLPVQGCCWECPLEMQTLSPEANATLHSCHLSLFSRLSLLMAEPVRPLHPRKYKQNQLSAEPIPVTQVPGASPLSAVSRRVPPCAGWKKSSCCLRGEGDVLSFSSFAGS